MFKAKSWWFNDEEDNQSVSKSTKLTCTATLYEHQERAIEWLKHRHQGAMLCLVMGLGKSLTVTYWALMIEQAKTVLLIVAKSLVPNWIDMLKQFFPGLSYDVLHADIGKNPRKYTNEKKSRFIITTYDVVLSMSVLHKTKLLITSDDAKTMRRTPSTLLCEGPGSWMFSTQFDVVIADESQIFRNPCGQLYPAMMALTANKYVSLTATPIQNTFDDLYTQMRFLGFEEVNDFKTFDEEFFAEAKLGEHVLFMDYESAGIFLPECHDNEIKLFYTDDERQAYQILREQTLLELNERPAHILALITRLRFACISIGLAYRKKNLLQVPESLRANLRNPASVFWANSTKLVKVREIIGEVISRGEKVIIFSTFQTALKNLGDTVKTLMGIHPISIDGTMDIEHRQSIIKTFKTSVVHPVLMLSFRIGCEGLNLTEANNIIFLDSWWSPSVSRQAIARSLRIGQTKAVNVYRIRMANSIEDRVYTILQNKSAIVEEFESGQISDEVLKSLI